MAQPAQRPRPRKRAKKPPLRERLLTRAHERADQARQLRANPRIAGLWIRQALLRMWRLRGGGFYGIGFVATFLYTQAQSLFDDAAESAGLVDFLTSQLSEALIRLSADFLGNLITAFLWPLWLLSFTGAWGLLGMLITFLVFDRWIKPWINARFPD